MFNKYLRRTALKAAAVFMSLICITGAGAASANIPMTVNLSVSAAETENDFTYELTEQNEVTITAYNGSGGEVTVPSKINDKIVTAIGDKAFHGCNTLTKIILPDTLKTIGERAFWYCTSLTELVLPKSLTDIGSYAFFGCSKLSSVSFNKGLKSIGGWAFSGCTALSDAALPDGMTSVGNSAFDATAWYNRQQDGDVIIGKYYYRYKGTMPSFYQADIPSDIVVIADGAFSGCENLQTVTIPEGVVNIGASTFFGCTGLKTVTLPDTLKTIGTQAFCRCQGLEEIIIPQSVTSVENGTFSECTGLKRIVMFEGIKRIGLSDPDVSVNALPFENCQKLDKLVYVGTKESFETIEMDSITRTLLASIVVFVEPKEYTPEKIPTYGNDRPDNPNNNPNAQFAPIMQFFGINNDYDFMMLMFYVVAGFLVIVIILAIIVHIVRKKKRRKPQKDDNFDEPPQLPKWRGN